MGIIVWEGIPRQCADKAYSLFNEKIPKYGLSMEVRNHSSIEIVVIPIE